MRWLAGHLQFINAPMSGGNGSFGSSFRITGAFGGDLTMDLRYILHLALIILASARCFDHSLCLGLCVIFSKFYYNFIFLRLVAVLHLFCIEFGLKGSESPTGRGICPF
jgi:hypothetical protein